MELNRKVKELALANNLDYVGFASADMLESEPEGFRPSDYLPGAQAIISLGIKLTQGIQVVNRLAHNHGYPRHLIYSYLWHGFGFPSLHYLDRAALLITRLLEKEGYLAVPIMAASSFDIRNSLTEFSNMHAAVAAGIGELGWNGNVLTPDVGPRARFGSVITDAKLIPDPMYEGPALCEPDRCKRSDNGLPICAQVCPTKAIGTDFEVVRIGDRSFREANCDRWRCMWGSMGLSKDSLGLKDIPMPDEVGPGEVFEGMKARDPVQVTELMVIGRGDYCGKCIMECPAGKSQKVEEILLKIKNRQEDGDDIG